MWDTLDIPGTGPKQALQLIQRRQKKGEKGEQLLVVTTRPLSMIVVLLCS